jgi:hypothetical protein
MRHEVRIWPRTRRTAVNNLAVWRADFYMHLFHAPSQIFRVLPTASREGQSTCAVLPQRPDVHRRELHTEGLPPLRRSSVGGCTVYKPSFRYLQLLILR